MSYQNPFDNGDNLPPGVTQAQIDAHFSAPDEDQTEADEIDPIMQDLKERHAEIARRANSWIQHKSALLPLVRDLILLGCTVNMFDDDLNVIFTGDKQKFLAVVRVQFRHGLHPDLSSLKKGATEGSWFVYRDQLRIYTRFSSTVCRRVQVGTQLQEVPIYETRCESLVPDAAELPGGLATAAISAAEPEPALDFDDLPF
jgi:hypothetical protein